MEPPSNDLDGGMVCMLLVVVAGFSFLLGTLTRGW